MCRQSPTRTRGHEMVRDWVGTAPSPPIRIGVSSCLLGNRVRYDGDHKHDTLITDVLGRFFDFVPVCPEVAIGMGVPRPPIQLVSAAGGLRAVGVDNKQVDVTAALATYGRRMTRELKGISGYIFKSKSPSCGIQSAKVHTRRGRPSNKGTGIFAHEFTQRLPLLPVEDEVGLNAIPIRENFIERIFCYRRWQDLIASDLTRRKLARFHAIHRLTLMAHGNGHGQPLERLVDASATSLAEQSRLYAHGFMAILRHPATRRHHTRVLKHVLGYLASKLHQGDDAELRDAINEYRRGRFPWIAPVTLLNHHLRHFPHPDLTDQVYLKPSAQELLLRGYV